jgi:hypothetical protein
MRGGRRSVEAFEVLRLFAGGKWIRTISPALAKGLSAVAERRSRDEPAAARTSNTSVIGRIEPKGK